MGPIFLELQVYIIAALVVVGTIFVRRKFRWKGLFAFWLASPVLPTTFYVIQYWSRSPLSRYETLINAST